MGHSQIQTTQKYLHTLPDAQEQALAALSRIQTRKRPLTACRRLPSWPCRFDPVTRSSTFQPLSDRLSSSGRASDCRWISVAGPPRTLLRLTLLATRVEGLVHTEEVTVEA